MSGFPSLKNELRPKGPGKKAADRPEISDEAVEENSQRIADKWGAGRSEPTQALPAETEEMRELVSIRGYIPEYLDRDLAIKAATQRVTKTYLILEALAKAGYHVNPADLNKDRRRYKP